jgi:hypothetical protein
MKVAVMQPYFLPYIGYWQLISSVEAFVILDDVNYINRGWIARNRIAQSGVPLWLTLPLQGASQNKLIYTLDIAPDDGWRSRTLRTVRHAYGRAPCYQAIYGLFADLLGEAQGNLSSFLEGTIRRVLRFLDIEVEIIPTSRIIPKRGLKGSQRIIDICRSIGATEYVNLPGGVNLYHPAAFDEAGILLKVLRPQLENARLSSGANAGEVLSILDVLMMNKKDAVRRAVCEDKALIPMTA